MNDDEPQASGERPAGTPARTVEFTTEFATQRRWARVREGRFKVIVPAPEYPLVKHDSSGLFPTTPLP